MEDNQKKVSDTVKVKTKGKTRGCPSNNEKQLGHFLNYLLDSKKKEINEGIMNMIMYGQSAIPLSKPPQ